MKGLLLKDWYMMKKYCRAYLLFMAIFLAVSFVNDDSFYTFYPCLLCCMIPITLLSYDERSGWMKYSCTLPYTKQQIVSSKYLIGLLLMVPITAVTAVTQLFQMNAAGGEPVIGDFLMTLFSMWIFAMVSSSVSLPIIFRFGTEKGRIVYMVVVALFFVAIAIVSSLLTKIPLNGFAPDVLLIVLALFVMGLYALSWYLSVVFCRKREW